MLSNDTPTIDQFSEKALRPIVSSAGAKV